MQKLNAVGTYNRMKNKIKIYDEEGEEIGWIERDGKKTIIQNNG